MCDVVGAVLGAESAAVVVEPERFDEVDESPSALADDVERVPVGRVRFEVGDDELDVDAGALEGDRGLDRKSVV